MRGRGRGRRSTWSGGGQARILFRRIVGTLSRAGKTSIIAVAVAVTVAVHGTGAIAVRRTLSTLGAAHGLGGMGQRKEGWTAGHRGGAATARSHSFSAERQDTETTYTHGEIQREAERERHEREAKGKAAKGQN